MESETLLPLDKASEQLVKICSILVVCCFPASLLQVIVLYAQLHISSPSEVSPWSLYHNLATKSFQIPCKCHLPVLASH